VFQNLSFCRFGAEIRFWSCWSVKCEEKVRLKLHCAGVARGSCSWTTAPQQLRTKHARGWRTAHASSIDEKGLIVQPKSNFRPDSCGYYWYMVSCAKSSLGWLPRGKHGQTHSLKNHNRRPHIADGHIRFILLFPFEIRKNVEARDHGTMPEAPCSEGEALNFCWWWLWCLGTNLKPENTGRTP